MDVRQVGLGALSLAVSGAILITSGNPAGHLLLGLSGAGFVGLFAGGVNERSDGGRWPV